MARHLLLWRWTICGLLALAGGARAAATPACTPDPWDPVWSVAQLPPEVEALVRNGAGLADPGQPYNAGDVVDASRPMRRLMRAVVGRNCVEVQVEQGGRASSVYVASFARVNDHWERAGKRILSPDEARTARLQPSPGLPAPASSH